MFTNLKGFKDALMATITSKYLISPSSATIFTSELPSNFTTPVGTGANTPQPGMPMMQQPMMNMGSSQVNPLLLQATTGMNPAYQQLQPNNPYIQHQLPTLHSGHSQSPTSIKVAKMPEYFPEWKDAGFDEAAFLGAQIAAKVVFIIDQGSSKGFLMRSDYNELGPSGIHDCSL
jgi:actin-related protein 9